MLISRGIHYYFEYRSQNIGFAEWINLLTLCLAPLIAHVLAGAPDPIITADAPPPWIDRLCHYNPTSIVWRYFIITDRRVRTKNWSADDMVAANSVFWTNAGWYSPGSTTEKTSAPKMLPRKSRIRFFSASTLKTVIVTLQGVQAAYALSESLIKQKRILSIENLFLPLAILSLLRLPAAPWLFDDAAHFHHATCRLPEPVSSSPSSSQFPSPPSASPSSTTITSSSLSSPSSSSSISPPASSSSTEHFFPPDSDHAEPPKTTGRLLPQSHPAALAVRVYFFAYLLGALVLALLHYLPPYSLAFAVRRRPSAEQGGGGEGEGVEGIEEWQSWWPATWVLHAVFLCSLAGATTLVLLAYVVLGRTDGSAVVPCLTARWYRAYTVYLCALGAVLVVVGALETRRDAASGMYTVYAPGL